MKNLFASLALLCSISMTAQTIPQDFTGQILCSDQRTRNVFIMSRDIPWSSPEAVLWQWNPKQDDTLSDEEKKCFGNPSDTKVALNGTHIIVVTSGGVAVLVNLATRKTEFLALPKGNPHSADLLPDGTLVTASSTGCKLMLFSRKDNGSRPYKSSTFKLNGAHGVVWDAKRQLVWALGNTELVAYTYNFDIENPQLTRVKSVNLGKKPFYGHDLVLLKERDQFLLTGGRVLLYDIPTDRLSLYSPQPSVKSISVHPIDGTVLVQIPNEQWWNESLSVLYTPKRWTLPKARFYKARWFLP